MDCVKYKKYNEIRQRKWINEERLKIIKVLQIQKHWKLHI